MSQEKSNNSIWLLLLGGFIILWFLGRIIALCLAFGGLIWWGYEKYVKKGAKDDQETALTMAGAGGALYVVILVFSWIFMPSACDCKEAFMNRTFGRDFSSFDIDYCIEKWNDDRDDISGLSETNEKRAYLSADDYWLMKCNGDF